MFVFSEESEKEIERNLAKYPFKKSALLPLLHVAQDQEGYVTPEAMEEIGKRLDVSPAYVESVATFTPCSTPGQWGSTSFCFATT